jgi:predicted DNA-binding transcriptional regulator AlpA
MAIQQNPLPKTGFFRLPQIIGNKKAMPPIPPLIPVSRTSWLNGVKSGKYPKPVKLDKRTTMWRVEDIRNLLDSIEGGQHDWEHPKQTFNYFPFGGSFGYSESQHEKW